MWDTTLIYQQLMLAFARHASLTAAKFVTHRLTLFQRILERLQYMFRIGVFYKEVKR